MNFIGKTMRGLTSVLATALVALAAASAGAQAPVELKLATIAPLNTPWQRQLDRFASDVANETGGSLKISVFYGGQLAAKKRIATPEDIRGMKVGATINKQITEFLQLYGAVPVALSAPEAVASLSAGLVDAVVEPTAYYLSTGMNKVAPVFNAINYQHQPAVLIINKGLYDKLSPEHRAGIDRAMAKVPSSQLRAEIATAEKMVFAKHKETGGTLVEPTPAQKAEWKKPLPAFWQSVAKDLGPDAEKMFATMEAAKKTCGK